MMTKSITEGQLWEWMMEGRYPPGYPDITRPDLVPLERRACATLSRDVVFKDRRKKVIWPAGTRIKIVMASRLGDVGITNNLNAHHGYQYRVNCVEGEWDALGDGSKIITLKPENLLVDISLIEDPRAEEILNG